MKTLMNLAGCAALNVVLFGALVSLSRAQMAPRGGTGVPSQQALISTSAQPVVAIVPAKHIELFNGKDLSGWTFCLRSNAEPSSTFTVTNGVIHCTGQPFGYMRTANSYRDYRLSVEWRFVKPVPRADNSGVFVHVQPPDQVWPKCIECQGQFHHQGDLILMNGATAKDYDTPQKRNIRMREASNEKAGGEWNTYEMECAGDSLKVFVNGKLMNEATQCSVSSGAIALQSEGGEWEVRRVSLEPLQP